VTLPAAGWFPDPRDTSRLRWWDGHAWGAATRMTAARPGPAVPAVVAPAGPSFSVQDGPLRTGSWASGAASPRAGIAAAAAVVLALLSVVWNPLGLVGGLALLAGVLGIGGPGNGGGLRVLARSLAASAVVIAVGTGAVAASAQYHLF